MATSTPGQSDAEGRYTHCIRPLGLGTGLYYPAGDRGDVLAYTRRRLLVVAGGLTLAGCSTSPTDPSETPDTGPFTIRNRDDKVRLLTLLVQRDDDVLHDRSYELSPGERQEIGNPIEEEGNYELTVELETGTSERETWTLGKCERLEHIIVIVGTAGTVDVETERETVEPSSCR